MVDRYIVKMYFAIGCKFHIYKFVYRKKIICLLLSHRMAKLIGCDIIMPPAKTQISLGFQYCLEVILKAIRHWIN